MLSSTLGLLLTMEISEFLSMVTTWDSFLRHLTVQLLYSTSLSRSSWYPNASLSLRIQICISFVELVRELSANERKD